MLEAAARLVDEGLGRICFPKVTGAQMDFREAPSRTRSRRQPGTQRGVVAAVPTFQGSGEIAVLDEMVLGRFGVREPPDSWPAVVPDLVLVPGLAFSRAGDRLGYGGGFYDRWVASHCSAHREGHPPVGAGGRGRWDRPQLVGIAFDFQVMSRVPRNGWDLVLDILITASGAVFMPAACREQP